jgi:hypothetical protein
VADSPRMRHRSRARLVMFTAVALGGCMQLKHPGIEHPPGVAPRCEDGVCLEIVSFYVSVDTIGAFIEAPPGTRLLNARVTAHDAPPCRGQDSVAWVTIDRDVRRVGPADVSGAHGLVLGFSPTIWYGHWWSPMFVDLELDVAGARRCMRTRLLDSAGKEAVGK